MEQQCTCQNSKVDYNNYAKNLREQTFNIIYLYNVGCFEHLENSPSLYLNNIKPTNQNQTCLQHCYAIFFKSNCLQSTFLLKDFLLKEIYIFSYCKGWDPGLLSRNFGVLAGELLLWKNLESFSTRAVTKVSIRMFPFTCPWSPGVV